jgi:uncharacterized protein (TIGR02594 family)
MRATISALVLALFASTSACTQVLETQKTSIHTAAQYVGLDERNNRKELKELMSVDPVRTEWCAAFVNAILEIEGIPGSESVSENPLMARSFLTWGTRVEAHDIQMGDVVVFPRGNVTWQGHVGFYAGTVYKDNTTYWIILGGNQDNTVSYAYYSPNYAIGIRRWLPTDSSTSHLQ